MRRSLAASTLVLAFALTTSVARGDSGEYTIDVPLAAVSPTGVFPIFVTTPTLVAAGTIRLDLDMAGKITGSVDFPGHHDVITGTFTSSNGRDTLRLRTAGRGTMKFTGELAGDSFVGKFSDAGTLTRGAGSFSISVANAHPLTAKIAVSMHGGFGSVRQGTGTVAEDAVATAVTATLTTGGVRQLRVRGAGFDVKGTGTISGGKLRLASWSGRGYGVVAAGSNLEAPYEAVPDVTILVVSGDPLETALPVDLGATVAPLLAQMLNARGLEVRTAAFGDTDGEEPDAGYLALVTKLTQVRDADVIPRVFPTKIVVVGFGHGAVRAHAAVRDVPDAPVEALVDIDATSCGWAAQNHDTTRIGGDPVGAVTISTVPFDVEDVIFDSVAMNLEVRSAAVCPVALSGGATGIKFDERSNRRLDSRVDGLFQIDTTTSHEELVDVAGSTLPRIGGWLADVLSAPAKEPRRQGRR